MATLVSPGVSVSVINESFYVPASAPTVPLFFIATRSNKTQPNGISPAAGTQEAGVVRTVTSLTQSLELFGIPYFHKDASGNEFHGDARNEYGLFALNQFLNNGARAYVVRANLDLNDEPITFLSLGTPIMATNSMVFNGIGNGTISNVTAVSNQVRPQTITVEIKSTASNAATFAVTGSVSGYIGAGAVGTPFTSTQVNFSMLVGSVPFAVGDKFMFDLAYSPAATAGNTGNGVIENLVVDTLAVPETFTITMTSPTAFDVTGTVSGPAGNGVVNSPFDNNRVNFILRSGSAAFVAGDSFSFTISQVTIQTPLGANDAARRVAIATAMQAEINSNTEVRSELYEYNLILAPGYHEVVDEMLSLSRSIGEEALVIADTPANLSPEQVAQWSLTSERQSSTNVAYYYPWCVASNLDGRNVLAAPSGTGLATIAYSDDAGYVWTPPAGVSRGQTVGIAKVGYFSGTPGTATTFIESNLNGGQRDNLYEYDKNINPIVFFPGRGILVWGQKTSAPGASALDRINVVRLVMYIRRSLRKSLQPFLFEPNDKQTRENVKSTVDGFLADIVVKRGLYDFATVCSDVNNTPTRIDRNELWVDVALKPTKAVEFIYVPIRILSTGAQF